jgi:hypothetical protein
MDPIESIGLVDLSESGESGTGLAAFEAVILRIDS